MNCCRSSSTGSDLKILESVDRAIKEFRIMLPLVSGGRPDNQTVLDRYKLLSDMVKHIDTIMLGN